MKKGFTLIEILVSFSILILISSAFFYFFKAGMDRQINSRDFFASLNRAQEIMEELRAEPFAEVISKTWPEGQIKVTPVTANLKEILLTLTRPTPHPPLIIYTLRSKI